MRAIGSLAALGGLAFALLGCGGDGAPSIDWREGDPPRLIILGVDGFDWNITDPLVAAGRMPHLAELQRQGTRADLLTLVPLEKSPVIWTTIATGRLPEQQGRGFLIESGPDSAKAFTAWNRTTRAFWNIFPDFGYSVSVLGWLETWPAERIDGTIISDYVQYDVGEREKLARFDHRTHPPELYDDVVAPLVTFPRDVSDADLARFHALGSREPSAAEAQGLKDLRWILAGDLTFTRLAEEFLQKHSEPVMAIFLRGPDAVCHKFWGAREAKDEGRTANMARAFGETVDEYFEATDELLGRILAHVDLGRTNLLLVSDHGFQGGRQALDGSPRQGIWMHRELGTALLAGPAAAGGDLRVEGLQVADVFPTSLHLLGLPVAEDLDGEVATWLLGPEGRERSIEFVDTFETGERPDLPIATESLVDEQIRERVEALGYSE